MICMCFAFDQTIDGLKAATPLKWCVGLVLLTVGQLLNVSVVKAIGVEGVLYGCRYGYVSPWVEGWPFNLMKDPQYCGVTISLLGIAIIVYNHGGDNSHIIGPLLGDMIAHMAIIHMERGENKSIRPASPQSAKPCRSRKIDRRSRGG